MKSAELYAPLVTKIDARLARLASPLMSSDNELARAVEYSLLAPGKRLRPLLTLLIANGETSVGDIALDIGCACEMVHAASLILDDLPSMDDAAVRRGRACTHIQFSESTAILAATALLNEAYAVVAHQEGLSAVQKVELIQQLTSAIGAAGLIGGQFEDLTNCEDADRQAIIARYVKKTGALFEFSIIAGAILRGLDEQARDSLKTVSRHLGLAFQIHDDLLDLNATTVETQKDCGKDANKKTYVSAKSPSEIREKIIWRKDNALSALSAAGVVGGLEILIAEQFDLAIERAG